MKINTWGEFEYAVKETITEMVNNTNPGGEYQAFLASRALYQQILPAINQFYSQMKSGALGNPSEENFDKMVDTFWGRLKDSGITGDIGWNKERFKLALDEKVNNFHVQYEEHTNSLEDMACFRFAADARTKDGEYWSLENLGNLASIAESLDLKQFDKKDIRDTIMNELGRHASRQSGLDMEDNVQVYLCGGYGHSTSVADLGEGQLLPEHMWIEIHIDGKPTISIDTFPSRPPRTIIGARVVNDFTGPPSEPNRVETADKTYKQQIPGLPIGVMDALANDNLTVFKNGNASGYRKAPVFIKPNGDIVTGAKATKSFQYATGDKKALALVDLNQQLDTYVRGLNARQSEYSYGAIGGFFKSIGVSSGFSKTEKLAAIDNLKKQFTEDEPTPLTQKDIDVLNEGSLGGIIQPLLNDEFLGPELRDKLQVARGPDLARD